MTWLAAVVGFFTALLKAVGAVSQSLYYNRAKQAGRTEAENETLQSEIQTTRRANAIDAETRALDADALERRLRPPAADH